MSKAITAMMINSVVPGIPHANVLGVIVKILIAYPVPISRDNALGNSTCHVAGIRGSPD